MGYKGTIGKTNFVLGEISPRAMGRFDQDKPIYKNGAAIIENCIISEDGEVIFSPGTQYVATAGQTDPVRLEVFKYNILQQYIIEFGNQYLQFYANAGQLLNNGSIVNIPSPYFQPDIFQLQMANEQDVGYISHQNYTQYKLVRISSTNFTIHPVQFIGGPFLDPNIGNVTIQASAATGSITLTAVIPAWASGTQYIPGDYVTNGGNTYIATQTNVGGSVLNSGAPSSSPTVYANDNSNGGTLPWNLSTLTVNNLVGNPQETTEYLKFTNFGFNIPNTASISGIVVNVVRNAVTLFTHPLVFDSSIKLIKGGVISGTDHSNGDPWYVSPTLDSFGSNADMWGLSLTYADINNPNFGVAIACTLPGRGPSSNSFATIDSVSITIYYSIGNFAADLAAGYWQQVSGFFQPGHVGALWSMGASTPNSTPPEPAATVVITGFTSSTVVSGYVQNNPDGTEGSISTTAPTTQWAEGAWSMVRGFPAGVCFHEGRALYGGTRYQPKTIWASVVGAYENFSKGQGTDSDAWTYTSSLGDEIQWMKSMMVNGTTGLRVGTSGGCLVWLDGSTSGITPISPPTIAMGVDYQAQNIMPQAISSYLYYMVGNSFQLRQLIYDFVNAADKSDNMNLLADHILRDGGGVIQIARQESPNDRIWCIRADGQIAIMTRNVDQLVTGWSRRVSGVQCSGVDTFNSIAINTQSGADDLVWVAVGRTINGVQVQFIEIFTPELFNNFWEPCCLDASLTYDNPFNITSVTSITGNFLQDDNGNIVYDDNGQPILGS